MNKQRLIIAALAIIGMICTFLPWATVDILGASKTVKGTEGDGWITFVIFIIPLIFAFLGEKKQGLKFKQKMGVVIPGLLASFVGVIDVMDIKDKGGDMVGLGIGLILLILIGVAIAVVPFAVKSKKD
jgi:hypothetical protein